VRISTALALASRAISAVERVERGTRRAVGVFVPSDRWGLGWADRLFDSNIGVLIVIMPPR